MFTIWDELDFLNYLIEKEKLKYSHRIKDPALRLSKIGNVYNNENLIHLVIE